MVELGTDHAIPRLLVTFAIATFAWLTVSAGAEAQPQPPLPCGEVEAERAQAHNELSGNYREYGANVAAYMQKCAKGETITVPQPFAGSYCDLNKLALHEHGRVICIKR